MPTSLSSVLPQAVPRTPYKKNKSAFADKIIKYKDSPTGKAYIGINKTPLMPAASKGFGFQGVLMQDDNREFVQCHACGEWFKKLNCAHLKKCCKLTVRGYKIKYGLRLKQGLISDEDSFVLTKAILKNKEFGKKPSSAMGKMGGRLKGRKGFPMAYHNRYGTCPLQLKARLIEFIKCNRELPSSRNRGRNIHANLRHRYGNFNKALCVHGFPWLESKGSTMRYHFKDGSVYKYNINQFYDRELLYKMIMKKCPVMRKK